MPVSQILLGLAIVLLVVTIVLQFWVVSRIESSDLTAARDLSYGAAGLGGLAALLVVGGLLTAGKY